MYSISAFINDDPEPLTCLWKVTPDTPVRLKLGTEWAVQDAGYPFFLDFGVLARGYSVIDCLIHPRRAPLPAQCGLFAEVGDPGAHDLFDVGYGCGVAGFGADVAG